MMMTSFFNNISNGDSIKVYKKNASMNPNTVSPIANHNYRKYNYKLASLKIINFLCRLPFLNCTHDSNIKHK